MKIIPFGQALEIIEAAAAVIVDDRHLTFPSIDWEVANDEEFLILEYSSNCEGFRRDQNLTAKIDESGRVVFINTRGEEARLMPLHSRPVEL